MAQTRKIKRQLLLLFFLLAQLMMARPVFAAPGPGVVDKLLGVFAEWALALAGFITKLILLIIDVLIPIMLYNNFSTNEVVTAGWTIVRDTMNMFFVIILIVIAFGTIFGVQRFQWQQQIGRMMVFAIVINFSKTLCGLMIDFSQIIMLTFANALREIAAGNFIQLFGLDMIYSISTTTASISDAVNSTGNPLAAFDWFAAGLAAIFLTIIVLVTMLALLAILLYRIVMFWVLIVLAPMAWFMGGIKDIVKESDAYGKWWKEFKCLLAIGPVLTFFLWLTLAVAGAGNIAAKSGFTIDYSSGSGSNVADFLPKIFELDRFMSFIIGIAMLYAGFQAAQDVCSAAKAAFIKTAVGKAQGAGEKLARLGAGGAARLGAKGVGLAGGLVKGGARGLARGVGSKLSKVPGVRALTKPGRADLYRRLAKATGESRFGRIFAPTLERAAAATEASRRAEVTKAGERYKKDTTETKTNQLKRFAEKGAVTRGGDLEAMSLFKDMLSNEDMQDEMRASGKIPELMKKYGTKFEDQFRGDPETLKKLKAFKKKNADVTGSTNLIQTEDDVRNLADDALLDKKVQDRLQSLMITKKDKQGNVTEVNAWDAVTEGRFGESKRDIAREGKTGTAHEYMDDAELRRVKGDQIVSGGSTDALVRAMQLALKDGDFAKAESLSAGISERYDRETGTDRFETATAIDRLQAVLKEFSGDEQLNRASRLKAGELGNTIGIERADSELKRGFGAGGITAFGELKPLQDVKNPKTFVQQHFAHASKDRREEATKQMDSQIATAQTTRTGMDSDLQTKQAIIVAQTDVHFKNRIKELQDEINKNNATKDFSKNKPLQEQLVTLRVNQSKFSGATTDEERVKQLDDKLITELRLVKTNVEEWKKVQKQAETLDQQIQQIQQVKDELNKLPKA